MGCPRCKAVYIKGCTIVATSYYFPLNSYSSSFLAVHNFSKNFRGESAEIWERGNYVAAFGAEVFAARHLSMVYKCQQPQVTLRMVEIAYEESGFQHSDGHSATLVETPGLDLNFTRAMIYRDVATEMGRSIY